MDIKNKYFPYPILWDKKQDYNNSHFTCDIKIKRLIKKFEIEIEFKLENDELLSLIEQEKVEYLIHIECPLTSYREITASKEPNITKILIDEEIKGKVSFCPFLVAKTEIPKYKNKNFNPLYGNATFNIERGTMLAIAPQINLNVSNENEEFKDVPSIFTIYRVETDQKTEMDVNLDGDKIMIALNIKDYERYCYHAANSPYLINTVIILPALVNTLDQLDNIEQYSDCRWFKALEKI